jgi:hypothetical protein
MQNQRALKTALAREHHLGLSLYDATRSIVHCSAPKVAA